MNVLIATLGNQPQVVTLALDLLRQNDVEIEKVFIVHTSREQPEIGRCVDVLQDEITSRYRLLDAIFTPITDRRGQTIEDVITPDDSAAVFHCIYHLLREAKEKKHTVHLSAAGGRKAMAEYSILAAQLLFDHDDRFWNLYSPYELLAAGQLHDSTGKASLIRLPILSWRVGLIEKEAFIHDCLSPSETEVLRLLAKGLSQNEISEERVTTNSTTDTHIQNIYEEYRRFFTVSDDIRVDRGTIIQEFAPYFEALEALAEAGLAENF